MTRTLAMMLRPDEIRADRRLLDGRGVAAATGLAYSAARDGAVWTAADKLTLRPPAVPAAFTADDALVLELDVADGRACDILVTVAGPQVGVSSAQAIARTLDQGPGAHRSCIELVLPASAFAPDLAATPVREVALGLYYTDQPVWLRGLRLQQRGEPPGPRLSESDFFSLLDPAVPATSWPELRRLLAQRSAPSHDFADLPSATDLTAADEICRNIVHGHAFADAIDWRRSAEVGDSLNRHYFMATLIDAYKVTREPRYARKLNDLIDDWIRTHPCPDHNVSGRPDAWSTLDAGGRFKRTWLQLLFSLLPDPAFTDETFGMVLRATVEHGHFLEQRSKGFLTNWQVVEAQALFLIGLALPELNCGDRWRDLGLARLSRCIEHQVLPDGAHHELAPGYHHSCMTAFSRPYRLALRNNLPVPAIYGRRLLAMLRFLRLLATPNGNWPRHNDAGWLVDGRVVEPLTAGELFPDPLLRWFDSRGSEGTAPDFTSCDFPDAGFSIMRSSWEADAQYLFFDGGPCGAAHYHEDKLSFELHAMGRAFIMDPGISSYAIERQFIDYYRGTAAHNTVIVDGGSQRRGDLYPRGSAGRVRDRGERHWLTSDDLDAVVAEYREGYTTAGDVIHRRTVVFVRPDYWVIGDELLGSGEHLLETFWHFAPCRLQTDDEGRCWTRHVRGANLEIVPASATEVSVVCGATTPVQGWQASNDGDVPAPCASHRCRVSLPWRQFYVLYPYSGRERSDIKVVRMAEDAGIEVQHRSGRRDRVRIVPRPTLRRV